MNTFKLGAIAACALLPLLLGGCATKPAAVDGAMPNSRRLVTSSLDEQAALGVARQRTIYPAHFIPETAALNELGVHDLTVLADALGRHPGELSVRRAQAPEALYESRVRAVRSFLESRGVQVARMSFSDAWPGGDGLGAQAVILRFLGSEAAVGEAKGPAGGAPPAAIGAP